MKREIELFTTKVMLQFRDQRGDTDIDIPADDLLTSWLATLRYEVDSRGRIKLESKDDMAKRGVQFCLALA